MGAFCVCYMPNAGQYQRNQKADAPGIIGRKCEYTDQAANAADKDAYLLDDDRKLADHVLLPFTVSLTTSHT